MLSLQDVLSLLLGHVRVQPALLILESSGGFLLHELLVFFRELTGALGLLGVEELVVHQWIQHLLSLYRGCHFLAHGRLGLHAV